jgi:hypothetical protein
MLSNATLTQRSISAIWNACGPFGPRVDSFRLNCFSLALVGHADHHKTLSIFYRFPCGRRSVQNKFPDTDGNWEPLAFFTVAVISSLTAELAVSIGLNIITPAYRNRTHRCIYVWVNIAYGVGAACELLLYHCIVRHVVLFLLSFSGTSYRRSSEYLVHLVDRIYDHTEHS